MKVYVYRFIHSNESKCRFSDKPFNRGIKANGANYFSTFYTEDPDYDELCDFIIKEFKIPIHTDFEIEL